MLTEAMNNTDGSGGVLWSIFSMIESNLFFLSLNESFKYLIVLLFKLSNKFIVHRDDSAYANI